MIEAILTILVLLISTGILLVYILKIKPKRFSTVKDLYAEGLDLMVSGKRKAAYNNFKDIIGTDSDNVKAYLRLGQVLREGGNPKQAIRIHKGLSHRKNLNHYEKIELYKNLSLDYYKSNKVNAAINELEKLLKIEKNNDWALSQLSDYYLAKQDWSNASIYLDKYLKLANKNDSHKLALFKIQEGRVLIKENKFIDSRKKFEEALEVSSDLAVAYYFIGISYSVESEEAYQKMQQAELDEQKKQYMEHAKSLLGKAIPMWIRYTELKPEQSWMVIHLLKDSFFALDRYSEFEDILKQILKNDNDNIEVIASLSEMYSHRGDNIEAIELIDSALEQDPTSLIVKLIKMKLEAKKEKYSVDFIRGMDNIIHFLVTDERYQIYKNTATDQDIVWLYGTADEKEIN